jgi:Uma2 family endonuclease
MYLTAEQERRQKRLSRQRGKPGVQFGRVVVAPELIVESISIGHEKHDKETKRRWYAEAGVKNYWLLHAYKRSLQCLVLDGDEYRVDQSGKGSAVLRPSAFPGLTVRLKELWG